MCQWQNRASNSIANSDKESEMQIIDLINIVLFLIALIASCIIIMIYGLKIKPTLSVISISLAAIAFGCWINYQTLPDYSELYEEVTGQILPLNSKIIVGKESDPDFFGDYTACALIRIQSDTVARLIEEIRSEQNLDTTGFYRIPLDIIEEPLSRQFQPVKAFNIIDTSRSYVRSVQIIAPDTLIVCRSST